jgi:LacI family transcriptional regulator
LSDSKLISDRTKVRVQRAAVRLGYVPSRQASLFARRRTYLIGLVVRSHPGITPFSRSYFPRALDGVVLEADAHEYSVSIVLDRKDGSLRDLVTVVRSRQVDGLLFTVPPVGDERFHELSEHGIPFVLINSREEGVSGVDGDCEPGMRRALDHLAGLGHRRIAYIAGDQNYWTGRDRLRVFEKIASINGMEYTVQPGDFSKSSGYRAVAACLRARPRPTAIMTASDRQALGVLTYCREQDIRVPEELSLVGFDDLEPAPEVTPSLTTVVNPIQAAAGVATRLLIRKIEEGDKETRHIFVPSAFAERSSTAPAQQQ